MLLNYFVGIANVLNIDWLNHNWVTQEEMVIEIFLKGLLLGFSIAAPVGPIGILCIRRTLAEGRLSGLFSGLGAATADAIYGSVAAFGLTFISAFLVNQQIWLRLVGGGFLFYLGLRTFVSKPVEQEVSVRSQGLLGAYSSTLFLTLTNPLTILSFAAIFAGLGIGAANKDYYSAGILVFGVFTGSASWWFLLSGSVGFFQTKFTPARLVWLNRLSGLMIIGFGLIAFTSVFSL